MIEVTWPDAVGTTGSIVLIIAFFLLQAGKIKGTGYAYLWMNFVGASLIMFSLFFVPNKASIFIEVFWIGISIYGLIKKRITKL